MKNVIKSLTVAIALSAVIAGPASAMISHSDVTKAINFSTGADSNVFASVQNDTVILSGYFSDTVVRQQTLRAALAETGVEKVIDNTTIRN